MCCSYMGPETAWIDVLTRPKQGDADQADRGGSDLLEVDEETDMTLKTNFH